MHLFYAPDFCPPDHLLGEEESKHCVRVLRLVRGDRIGLTDGRGTLYECRIEEADPRKCRIVAVSAHSEYGKLPYRLTMAVAPTKNAERFEWFVEKATEVGVGTIVPLGTARGERRLFRPDRAEKVITAAMKQSIKAYRPQLLPLTSFADFVTASFGGRRFIAHCGAPLGPTGKRHLAAALRPGEEAQVLIGPEGDFSPEEVRLALDHGFEEITLGTQRLRTETAAVAAVVIVSVLNTCSGS